jgi:hypothetical protein
MILKEWRSFQAWASKRERSRVRRARDTGQNDNGPVVSISLSNWHRLTASIRANTAIS